MKFCEKCGKEIPEGSIFCPNCGMSSAPQVPAQATYSVASPKQGVDIVAILCFVFAVLVFLFSLIACFKIMGGAGDMAELRSISGDTVAEAYYNYCGEVYSGFGLFMLAFGFFAGGMLACLGFKQLKK